MRLLGRCFRAAMLLLVVSGVSFLLYGMMDALNGDTELQIQDALVCGIFLLAATVGIEIERRAFGRLFKGHVWLGVIGVVLLMIPAWAKF